MESVAAAEGQVAADGKLIVAAVIEAAHITVGRASRTHVEVVGKRECSNGAAGAGIQRSAGRGGRRTIDCAAVLDELGASQGEGRGEARDIEGCAGRDGN